VSASAARRPDLGQPFGGPGPRTPDDMRIFTVDDLHRAYQAGHDAGRGHSWRTQYGIACDQFRAHYAGDHSRCERRDDVCIDRIDERPL